MDHTIVILSALLINALLAGPREWLAAFKLDRVAVLPGRAIRAVERKLNRDRRSAEDLRLRGVVVLLVAVIVAALAGALLGWIFKHNLRFVEIVLVALMLPVRPIWDRATAIRKALTANHLGEAREGLSGTIWKHHALLDEYGVARAIIEYLAVECSERIVCPVLGYMLLGLPGLLVCAVVTLLRDALIHAPQFGYPSQALHGWLHYLPSRLTALLWLAAACFFPMADPALCARQIGKPLIDAPARALNVYTGAMASRVALGGPGSPYLKIWTPGATTSALPSHVRRAQMAYALGVAFLFILVGAFF